VELEKIAHAAPAIPASTPTPCGMNVRISDTTCPNVPPINSNGKIGSPSKHFQICNRRLYYGMAQINFNEFQERNL
jgi:hypothetical protein